MTNDPWAELCHNNSGSLQEFRLWFDPDTFPWERNSAELAIFASHLIEEWWDEDLFEHKHGSVYLAEVCFKDFSLWWNKELFNYEASDMLAMFCGEHFDIWWDEKRYVWESADILSSNLSNRFDDWFNPDKILFDGYMVTELLISCREHMPKWYPHISDNEKQVLYHKLYPVDVLTLRKHGIKTLKPI
jgi:hypothetical protein